MFLIGHHIRHDLAGMRVFGEPVDDGHGRILGQLRDFTVIQRTDHDRIDKTRQDAGRIGDGFAATELHFSTCKHQRFTAKLAHADIKRHARTG